MKKLPCKSCIKFAICVSNQDLKRNSWSKLVPIYNCKDLFNYLTENTPTNYLFNNKRIYETYDLFLGKTKIGGR